MVVEAITGLQIFAQLFNTAKGLSEIHDAAVRDQAVFTLQRQILEAHTSQMALIQRVSDLEKQVASFENWDAEKQRYELTELNVGTAAYIVKEAMRGNEPIHCICTRCYEDRRKSILHMLKDSLGTVHIECPRCGLEMKCDGDRPDFPLPFPPSPPIV